MQHPLKISTELVAQDDEVEENIDGDEDDSGGFIVLSQLRDKITDATNCMKQAGLTADIAKNAAKMPAAIQRLSTIPPSIDKN